MCEKIRILLLSANPPNTSRIRVDQEAREIFERLEEGSMRDAFDLIPFQAFRAGELQRLLMKYKPRIVHFSGHGSLSQKIITEGAGAKGKKFDTQGLVKVFGLYKDHVRLVVLNACLTHGQAQALASEIDYTIGVDKNIGDKAAIKFAGAFYRALAFEMSVQKAFESAQAELLLQSVRRSKGFTLFARAGASPEAFTLRDNGPRDEQVTLKDGLDNLIDDDASGDELRMAGRAMLDGSVILKRIGDAVTQFATIDESSEVTGCGQAIRPQADPSRYERLQEELFPPPGLVPLCQG